jgi:GT2 family glycosyltransferase
MRDVVRHCLLSLRDITYPNHKIVVVDNNSADGTEEMLRSEFPDLTLIQTGSNMGYTGGNNKGIDYAIQQGANYVLIINPDTIIINPRFLNEMVDYTENHPEVGIAGPRVFLRHSDVVQNTVLFPPGLWQNTINWIRYRVNPKTLELSGNKIVETKVLNGVCLLIRVACLLRIGLFDENIFMYIEDADMDYRAHHHGWRVCYLPIDSIIHRQKHEGYHLTGFVSFLLKRNSVYYLYKTGKKSEAWGYAILSLLLMAVRAALTFDLDKFKEYLQFCRRLAIAYRQILLGRNLDKSFGPPFAQL